MQIFYLTFDVQIFYTLTETALPCPLSTLFSHTNSVMQFNVNMYVARWLAHTNKNNG